MLVVAKLQKSSAETFFLFTVPSRARGNRVKYKPLIGSLGVWWQWVDLVNQSVLRTVRTATTVGALVRDLHADVM